MRKHLRVNFIVVHRHEYFPPPIIELDCSKTSFDNPELFLSRSDATLQVMSLASPPVMIVQFRVTLEPGTTVIGSLCSGRRHPDREQDDLISHFVFIANEASVEWRENNYSTHYGLVGNKARRLLWFKRKTILNQSQRLETSSTTFRLLPLFISYIFTREKSFHFNHFFTIFTYVFNTIKWNLLLNFSLVSHSLKFRCPSYRCRVSPFIFLGVWHGSEQELTGGLNSLKRQVTKSRPRKKLIRTLGFTWRLPCHKS